MNSRQAQIFSSLFIKTTSFFQWPMSVCETKQISSNNTDMTISLHKINYKSYLPVSVWQMKRNLRFMQELRHLFGLMMGSRRKYVDPSKAVDILKEAFSSTVVSNTSVNDSQQVRQTDVQKYSVFSSPKHKVLGVSYCDRPLSVVRRRASSVVRRPSTF